jgi:hypothetical protein
VKPPYWKWLIGNRAGSDRRGFGSVERLPLYSRQRPSSLAALSDTKGQQQTYALRYECGDTKQEYFADGITEDIITALSKWRWFFVIARSSSFTYKGRHVDVKQVGQELGVRYVLEGSVRKAGDGRV